MPQHTGKRLPLSLPRRLICDLMECSKPVPFIPAERRIDVGALAHARERAHPRPGWCTIFLKAFAIAAAQRPELRRAYVAYPWPHLYEHPGNIASVAVERDIGDEQAVLFAQIRTPERQPIYEIERHLRRYKDQPLESIATYRRTLRIAAFPRPLRRLMWWHAYNFSGRRRAKYMGTFGISAVAGLGSSLLFLRSPLSATLNYGTLEDDGTMTVRLNFDHRVLDGGNAARALEEIDQILNCEILSEVRYLQALEAAA